MASRRGRTPYAPQTEPSPAPEQQPSTRGHTLAAYALGIVTGALLVCVLRGSQPLQPAPPPPVVAASADVAAATPHSATPPRIALPPASRPAASDLAAPPRVASTEAQPPSACAARAAAANADPHPLASATPVVYGDAAAAAKAPPAPRVFPPRTPTALVGAAPRPERRLPRESASQARTSTRPSSSSARAAAARRRSSGAARRPAARARYSTRRRPSCYYLKVDIEGFDQVCIDSLARVPFPHRPLYVSAEDQAALTSLENLGYGGFKLVPHLMWSVADDEHLPVAALGFEATATKAGLRRGARSPDWRSPDSVRRDYRFGKPAREAGGEQSDLYACRRDVCGGVVDWPAEP